MLEGKQSILFTDHKPLTFALFRTSLPWSAMQQRRLSFLSEFLQDPPSPRSRECCSWRPVRPEAYTVRQYLHALNNSNNTGFHTTSASSASSSRCIFLRDVPFQESCLKVEFLCHSSTLSVVSVPSSGSNNTVTHPQKSSAPWFQRRWEGLFLRWFTTFLILLKVPLEDWFQEVFSDKVSPGLSNYSLSPVKVASGAKFKPISSLILNKFRFLIEGFHIFF